MPPHPDQETIGRLDTAVESLEDQLLTPALVIDLDAVEHNADAIIAAAGGPKRWRPHIKTVKQSRIVRLLMKRGLMGLKCATLDELALVLGTAERVHPEGHVDVLLAYPPTRNVLRGVDELLDFHEGGRARLLADSPEHLRALDGWLADAKSRERITVLLDVDVGMGRTGSPPSVWLDHVDAIGDLAHARVVGLHGYEGHLEWEDRDAANAGYDDLLQIAGALGAERAKWIVTSGTHGFHHALAHGGLGAGPFAHQISPGTIVLSDLRSAPAARHLGLRQAAFVASRVISRPGKDRVTLDAGSKAMSPDRPAPACAILGRPDLEPLTPNEEHLPVAVGSGERPPLGALLWLVPEHVCTTVNLYRKAIYVRGDRLVGLGDIEARSRTARLSDNRP